MEGEGGKHPPRSYTSQKSLVLIGLTSSAQINYLQAIADMIDFRKFKGAAQSSARSFSLTEVCIHRGKRTLSKLKRYEWTKELHIDNLEAMNSWATLEEL